jgi:hypothetical protein
MSDHKPGKGQSKAKRLQLNKETLKDLSTSESANKKAMGGAAMATLVTNCTCGSCVATCAGCRKIG